MRVFVDFNKIRSRLEEVLMARAANRRAAEAGTNGDIEMIEGYVGLLLMCSRRRTDWSILPSLNRLDDRSFSLPFLGCSFIEWPLITFLFRHICTFLFTLNTRSPLYSKSAFI